MRYRSLLIGSLSLMWCCTATMAATPEWSDLGHDVLLQSKNGLHWARQDNGKDINWSNAQAYCTRMGAGWRLPSVEELKSVYAAARDGREMAECGDDTCAAPALMKLSGAWHWSNAPVTQDQSYDFQQLAWGVTLVNGRQTMALRFGASASRALCVKNA